MPFDRRGMFLPVFHIRTRLLLRLVNPMTYFDSLFDTNSIGCSLILSVMNMRNLSFLIMIVTIAPPFVFSLVSGCRC